PPSPGSAARAQPPRSPRPAPGARPGNGNAGDAPDLRPAHGPLTRLASRRVVGSAIRPFIRIPGLVPEGIAHASLTPMNKRSLRGFTLIELVVVISILAILSGVLVPRVTNHLKAARDARRLADIKAVH